MNQAYFRSPLHFKGRSLLCEGTLYAHGSRLTIHGSRLTIYGTFKNNNQ
jgi:hypothetical protein